MVTEGNAHSIKEGEKIRNLIYPEPPVETYCSKRFTPSGGSAIVWWRPSPNNDENDLKITAWEVHRYRRDIGHTEWRQKGFALIENDADLLKYRVRIDELSNGYQYYFTMKARSGDYNISRVESPMSNVITIDEPLPTGWLRIYDDHSNRFCYVHERTHDVMWSRPDKDPNFLENLFLITFNKAELAKLKKIFDEEMYRFNEVTIVRLQIVFLQLGERVRQGTLRGLIRGFAGGEGYSLDKWPEFLAVCGQLKRNRNTTFLRKISLVASSTNYYCRSLFCGVQREFGHWRRDWHSTGKRFLYRNMKTKAKTWDTPEEVRLYLPMAIELKVLEVMDDLRLDAMREIFLWADTEFSGSLSDKAFRALLKQMNIQIGNFATSQLRRQIDDNSNGTVEFSEFCAMIHKLAVEPTKRSGVWRKLPSYEDVDFTIPERNLDFLWDGASEVASLPDDRSIDSSAHGSVGSRASSRVGHKSSAAKNGGRKGKKLASPVKWEDAGETGPDSPAGSKPGWRGLGARIIPEEPHDRHCLCGCRKIED